MVAQRAAAVAGIALAQVLRVAVAQLRIALPGEGEHGREGDVGGLEGLHLADGALVKQLLEAGHDRVVVQLQLDLAHDAGLLGQLDHLVVLLHVEGGDLHGQDVDAALGAQLHLAQVLLVGGGDDHGLDLRMGVQHLDVAAVAGHALNGLEEQLAGEIVGGGHGDPIQLRVLLEDLIILARMTVRHTHHGNLQRFHGINPPQSVSCRSRRTHRPALPACPAVRSDGSSPPARRGS